MLRVYAAGRELAIEAGVVRLEESRTYAVRLLDAAAGAEVRFAGVALTPRDGSYALAIDHWVGVAHLEVLRDGAPLQPPLRVEVQPRREKLSSSGWLAMLEDLERWLPAITVGSAGGEHGSVGRAGGSAPLVAAALGPLVPPLVKALRGLAAAPRYRTHEQLDDVHVRSLRRVDRGIVAWACRHPEVVTAADVWTASEASATAPQLRGFDTSDHAANRFVAWLTRRVIAALDGIVSDLEERVTRAEPEGRAWYERRIALLGEGRRSVDGVLRTSFLGRLMPEPPSERALLAVRNDPVYARVHRLARPFLSPAFQLASSPAMPSASVRPSFGIYELWTFLAVQQLVQRALPGLTWRARKLDRLFDGTGAGASLIGRGAIGTMAVRFNLPFVSYLNRGERERWSISRARRPDIVVTWTPASGLPRWMCIDAKYRVTEANLGDAFASAHIYRDSLRWPAMGGRCIAALLAVPAHDVECAPWFEPGYLEEHRVGATVLRPGQPSRAEVANLILSELMGVPTVGQSGTRRDSGT